MIAYSYSNIRDIRIGKDIPVQAVYKGECLVWKRDDGPVDYLRFTAGEAGSVLKLRTEAGSTPYSEPALEYSIDGVNWSTWDYATTFTSAGQTMYLRSASETQTEFSTSANAYIFAMTGPFSVAGNICCLLKKDGRVTSLTPHCFRSAFYNCKSLTDISQLVFPAENLAEYCYMSMFANCNGITTAPVLPAATLAPSCYNSMFIACKNLNYVKVGFSSWTVDDLIGTGSWLASVSSTGVFVCPLALGTDETIARGQSRCPTGWTVINE